MRESIEQISFRLTSDELSEQERTVAALRSSAGTILAAASVAGSLLAAGRREGSLGLLDVLATACFVACSTSAISVLLPRPFVFAFRGAALLRAAPERSDAEGTLDNQLCLARDRGRVVDHRRRGVS
jgi:hypothetical protein